MPDPEPLHRSGALRSADRPTRIERRGARGDGERFARIVENLPAGAVHVIGARVELNAAAERITGYGREEIRTVDRWFEALYGSRRNAARRLYEEHRRRMFPESVTLPITTKAGETRIVEFAGHRSDEEEIWLIHDTTERVHAQKALRESERRLHAIVETAVDTILTLDRNGLVVSANPAAATMFGHPVEDLLGRGLDRLVAVSEEGPPGVPPLEELTRGGAAGPGRHNRLFGVRRDGSRFPVDLAISAADPLDLYAVILRDTSDCRRYEALIGDLAEAEQERIGRDLHDTVGQELAGLALSAERQGRQLGDRPEAAVLHELADGIRSALSHVRAAARGLTRAAHDADSLRFALRELAASTRRHHGIECDVAFAPVGELSGEVANHLYRIAAEAVANAVQHARPTSIDVRLARRGDRLVLRVADDGIGLDPEAQAPGLGLSIMRHRADAIDAELRVGRRRGGGTAVLCARRVP